MAATVQVGDRVTWEFRQKTYGGFTISLREGTVIELDGEVAVIKPPNKYASRRRVHMSRLTVKGRTAAATAG